LEQQKLLMLLFPSNLTGLDGQNFLFIEREKKNKNLIYPPLYKFLHIELKNVTIKVRLI